MAETSVQLPETSVYDDLTRWGFEEPELSEALERLEAGDEPKFLVMDGGTVALDVKRQGDFSSDPTMGEVATVGSDNIARFGGNEVDFVEPDEEALARGNPGGIANAANAVAAVLANEAPPQRAHKIVPGIAREQAWAVWALLGNDSAGEHYQRKTHELIDTTHFKIDTTLPTGLSDVRIQNVQKPGADVGKYAIYFRPGASGTTMMTKEHLLEILMHRPFNFNISYPGLFADGMDGTDGRNLAWFAKEAQKICPAISIDTHSPTQLKHIESALPHLDMFNASLADAARIFLDKTDVNEDTIGEIGKRKLYSTIHTVLSEEFHPHRQNRRSALFTFTDKEGCSYGLFYPKGSNVRSYLQSPYAAIPAVDKTGAGDVRFAFQRLYIAMRRAESWERGIFGTKDAEKAIQIGQLAATLQIQGRENGNPFKGVTMDKLEKVVDSRKRFNDIDTLREAIAQV